MPNIYRFLIKTLCVCGVLFTLPHNNAWGAYGCCAYCTESDCYTDTTDPSCSTYTTAEIKRLYGYCTAAEQTWCSCSGRTLTCKAPMSEGLCWAGWDCQCPGSPPPPPGGGGKKQCNSDPDASKSFSGSCSLGCANQYESNGCCRPRKIKSSCGANFRFSYNDDKYHTDLYANSGCIPYDNPTSWVNVSCAFGYYLDVEGGYTDVTYIMSTNTTGSGDPHEITSCKGCSAKPCWDCKSHEGGTEFDSFWLQCDPDYLSPSIEIVKCNTPEDCGIPDCSNPTDCTTEQNDWYTKITKDPGIYFRKKTYTYSSSNNGSCTISFDDFDCILGYEYDATTKTCKPCTVGWTADTEPSGWRAICKQCPAGESTFTTKVINDKTVIVSHDTGKTTCEPCPLGYTARDNTYPPYDRKCFECAKGYYGITGTINTCTPCPNAFTSDTPNPSTGLINDSIQMCYIDPNVMLSDSLGKIKLSEEIGSGTKLYHQ